MRHSTLQRRLSLRRTPTLNNAGDNNKTQEKPEEKLNMNQWIIKTLSSRDPQKGKSYVFYSHHELKYFTYESEEHYLNILDMEPSVFHSNDKQSNIQSEYHSKKRKLKAKVKKIGEEFKENEKDSYKSMRNLLTYAERSSQTANPKILTRQVETQKLQRNNHSGICHYWDLFDSYMLKYIQDEELRKKELESKGMGEGKKKVKKVEKKIESLARPSLLKTLKLVERQIMQIKNAESYLCYREWSKQDDSQDSSKMLLNLLAFPQNASIRNRSVTAICWNPKFEDLFAVGYGNYSFPKKKDEKDKVESEEKSDDILENGYIFVFSIKNNYYPEIKYTTETGVLCLDFHPKNFSLLVTGMYDGTVAVYDIRQKIKTPILTCDIRIQRHMDPVWQVKWYNEFTEIDEYVFYSISSDGRVVKWSFVKNKNVLETEEIIKLKYSDSVHLQSDETTLGSNETNIGGNLSSTIGENDNGEKQDDALLFGHSGGMCFDFNPHKEFNHLFVLGTEEGHIHLCSVKHREHYMQSYEGHTMGVYAVAWNPFHPKLFGSCSSDWTIKIWHYKIYAPLVIFDMQSAVGDIAWNPWCSTIFAAVTVQGDIKFFDLNRERKTPLEPKRYREIAINHIAFNKFEYVFLTGNDQGKVRLWKFAEPLRTTVDKKDEDEKEMKKAMIANQANKPTTKIVVPKNLQDVTAKIKKHAVLKLEKRDVSQIFENEKKRILDFFYLLDVQDI